MCDTLPDKIIRLLRTIKRENIKQATYRYSTTTAFCHVDRCLVKFRSEFGPDIGSQD